MDKILFRRRLSWVEIVGRWFALAVALAALSALVNLDFDRLVALPPDTDEWSDAYSVWLSAFFGIAQLDLKLKSRPETLRVSAGYAHLFKHM